MASHATLGTRAHLLAAARDFLAARGVMEVDVPALIVDTVTDPHIEALRVCSSAMPGDGQFLHTSPEFAMKRLLAAGSPDIYFLGKVYRDGERGRRHQPEFTMLEWYRRGFDLAAMIDETCELVCTLAAAAGTKTGTGRHLTYQAAFLAATGLDPLAAETTALREAARRHIGQPVPALGEERSAWLDLLMSHVVIPALPRGELTVISQFPAAQAALARLAPRDPRVAERFEVYWAGLELANGYRELTEAEEQRRRFEADRRLRQAAGRPDVRPDPALLAALGSGLPDCCGVALGFDRLLMVVLGLDDICQAVSFPLGAPAT